jgi:hypothetical protein
MPFYSDPTENATEHERQIWRLCELMAQGYVQVLCDMLAVGQYPFDPCLLCYKRLGYSDWDFDSYYYFINCMDEITPEFIMHHNLLPDENPDDFNFVCQMHNHDCLFHNALLDDGEITTIDNYPEGPRYLAMLIWITNEREAGREPLNTRQWMEFEANDMHPLK